MLDYSYSHEADKPVAEGELVVDTRVVDIVADADTVEVDIADVEEYCP